MISQREAVIGGRDMTLGGFDLLPGGHNFPLGSTVQIGTLVVRTGGLTCSFTRSVIGQKLNINQGYYLKAVQARVEDERHRDAQNGSCLTLCGPIRIRALMPIPQVNVILMYWICVKPCY